MSTEAEAETLASMQRRLDGYLQLLPIDTLNANHLEDPIFAVQVTAATICRVTVGEVIAKGRRSDVVEAREIAFYICLNWKLGSQPVVGRRFGGREHATAAYGAQRFAEKLESGDTRADRRLRECLARLAVKPSSPLLPAPVQTLLEQPSVKQLELAFS